MVDSKPCELNVRDVSVSFDLSLLILVSNICQINGTLLYDIRNNNLKSLYIFPSANTKVWTFGTYKFQLNPINQFIQLRMY